MPKGIDPWKAVLREQKPLGLTLGAGTVTAVDTPVAGQCTVSTQGESLTAIPYAGGAPAVSDKVWLLRHGTTMLAVATNPLPDLDATYLRLDATNDPVTGELVVGTGGTAPTATDSNWIRTAPPSGAAGGTASIAIETPLGEFTWLGYKGTASNYLTFDTGGKTQIRLWNGSTLSSVVDASEGGVVINRPDAATIGGATFANGWLQVGTSSVGITIDPNEFYFAGQGNIGTITGDLLLRPAATTVLTLTSTSIEAGIQLIPDGDNTRYLGNSTNSWARLYTHAIYDENAVLRWDMSGDMTVAGTVYAAGDGTASSPSVKVGVSNLGFFYTSTSGGRINFTTAGVNRMLVTATPTLAPATDNSMGNGASGLRWTDVWAVDTTINSSDEAEKKNIAPVTPALAGQLVDLINPISFTRIGRTRTHWGFGALQVRGSLEDAGLDPAEYGVWIDPAANPSDEDVDIATEQGRTVGDFAKAIRPGELLPIAWAALKAAREEITALEARVAALEAAT